MGKWVQTSRAETDYERRREAAMLRKTVAMQVLEGAGVDVGKLLDFGRTHPDNELISARVDGKAS